MIASSTLSRVKTLLKISAAFVCACLLLAATSIQVASAQECRTGDTSSGDEAKQSTIKLQMPFVIGETWTVGGAGSFYGDKFHCNPWADHYATDWNRDGDVGAHVLAAADGTVDFVETTCPMTGLGCQVRINHADGYQTTYAHLQSVASGITAGVRVKTGTLIGYVGKTGTEEVHLHFSFKHLEDASYLSYCNSNCDAYEAPKSPQGYKPSPMMTIAGQVNLVDGASYTSVNGRIYLPSLRLGDG